MTAPTWLPTADAGRPAPTGYVYAVEVAGIGRVSSSYWLGYATAYAERVGYMGTVSIVLADDPYADGRNPWG